MPSVVMVTVFPQRPGIFTEPLSIKTESSILWLGRSRRLSDGTETDVNDM